MRRLLTIVALLLSLAGSAQADGLSYVNVNTATRAELVMCMGAKDADRILSARRERPFVYVTHIKPVLGSSRYYKLLSLLHVRGETR